MLLVCDVLSRFVLVCVVRLHIAFKWMVRAFSGYLSTDQLLLLWDRILGYDSLEIVAGGTRCVQGSVSQCQYSHGGLLCPPVLAAAVFAFRAENLMEVTSLASAEVRSFPVGLVHVTPLISVPS